MRATPLLHNLLELGVRPIPSSALLLAIPKPGFSDRDTGQLECLLKHGAPVHVEDNATDGSGIHREYTGTEELYGCVNAVKLAIKWTDHECIRLMLTAAGDTIDSWFRFFYLKEADTRLFPATVACLLEFPSLHLHETDLSDTVDLPLAHLVRDAETLCSPLYGHSHSWFDPVSKLKNADSWVACVAAFSQARVDPSMRDRAGKSALDYLGEHLAYVGRNRFKNNLASQLRSQLGREGRGSVRCAGLLRGPQDFGHQEGGLSWMP